MKGKSRTGSRYIEDKSRHQASGITVAWFINAYEFQKMTIYTSELTVNAAAHDQHNKTLCF